MKKNFFFFKVACSAKFSNFENPICQTIAKVIKKLNHFGFFVSDDFHELNRVNHLCMHFLQGTLQGQVTVKSKTVNFQ